MWSFQLARKSIFPCSIFRVIFLLPQSIRSQVPTPLCNLFSLSPLSPSLPPSLPPSPPPSLSPPLPVSGLAGENSLDNCELAGIVEAIADAWSEVFLAYFKQKSEQLKVCEIKGNGREGGREGRTREKVTHTNTRTAHAHTNACRTCKPLAHALTRTLSLSLALTCTHTHTRSHIHTQEEKVKELHEAILPPLLRQLNHMVETNNFAKGWIWGDKVYTYDEREEGKLQFYVNFSYANYAI